MNPDTHGALLPCGHRTRHTSRVGCCSGCGLLFSSDSAFEKHRRHSECLTPEDAGLVARDSQTAPGEVVYGWPTPDQRPSAWSKEPQDARGALREGPISDEPTEVAHPDPEPVSGPQRAAQQRETHPEESQP
jgi:hypothetical protein